MAVSRARLFPLLERQDASRAWRDEAYYATQRSPDRRGALRRGRLRARCAPSFESSPSRVSRSRARRDRRARLPAPVTPLTRQKNPPRSSASAGCEYHTNCASCVADTTCGWYVSRSDRPRPRRAGSIPSRRPSRPVASHSTICAPFSKLAPTPLPAPDRIRSISRRSRPRRWPPSRAPAPVPPDPPDSDAHPAPVHRPPLPPVQVR